MTSWYLAWDWVWILQTESISSIEMYAYTSDTDPGFWAEWSLIKKVYALLVINIIAESFEVFYKCRRFLCLRQRHSWLKLTFSIYLHDLGHYRTLQIASLYYLWMAMNSSSVFLLDALRLWNQRFFFVIDKRIK